MSRVKLPLLVVFFLFFCLVSMITPPFQAQDVLNPSILATEIDEFMGAGADGYLVWQYSGYAPSTGKVFFENDPYSFFREGSATDTEICAILKTKGSQYNSKSVGIGVNIWSLGNFPDAVITDHLQYLKSECGVKTIRVFAKASGVAGVRKVATAAQQVGLQLIVAIGDYSNGGGGIPRGAPKSWYESGYKSQPVDGIIYRQFSQELSSIPGITVFELANEPHCSGDDSALSAYTAWGIDIGGILSGKSTYLGYGQMASQETTMCDSTGSMRPSHFSQSNGVTAINITSAHYYTLSEKNSAKKALEQSIAISKPFYIGEAAAGDLSGKVDQGYDTSIYDDYAADPDKFYVHPIAGLVPNYDARQIGTVRADLIRQGYEAHCATPQFKIKLTQYGEKWMGSYIDAANGHPGGTVFGGDIVYDDSTEWDTEDIPYRSTLTVDYRNTLLPVFRDVSGKRWLTTSLEEYFGFKDTKVGDASLSELNSAPANSLLSRVQRCIQSATLLVKQEEMCKKIDQEEKCALYPRPIPDATRSDGTPYTVKLLLDDYKAFAGSEYTSPENMKLFCQVLMTNSPKINLSLREGMLNNPLTIDRAYRLGFLVTDIELLKPSLNRMFNLFTHPNAGFLSGAPPQPSDAILVNAFKIPDFATNKGEVNSILPRGNTYWTDSAMITRNSLLTEKQQKDTEATVSAKRTTLEVAAQVYDTRAQNDTDEIKCIIAGTKNNGIGGPECRDVLTKSLVDIVNAQVDLSEEAQRDGPRKSELQRQGFQYFQPECPTLQKEYSDEIADPGTLQPLTDESKVYTQEFGVQLLAQLFKDSTHELAEAGSEKDPSFAETWRDRPPFGTRDNMYGPEDDPNVTENSNAWGVTYDWGLKSVFAVVQEMKDKNFPNSCCNDARKVKHYLVYPVGYDMQSVQTVLAGTFFTSNELKTLATEAEKYDRIQVSGDQMAFEGGKKDKTYEDWNPNPPNWNPADDIGACTLVCKKWGPPDPITNERECLFEDYVLPCTRKFGFEVVTEGETLHAGILGGRFGFYTREIQKALNTKVSEARTYLDLCQTTEQFLKGKCGQKTTIIPTPTPDTCTAFSCGAPPPEPTNIPPTPPPPQHGCVRGERGREMCIVDGKLFIYDHNVDASGDGTPDEYCGGHVTVDSSVPAGCTLFKQKMWGFDSPGGPLSPELGCINLTQVTATFDSSGGSCSQETLSVVAN